MPVAPEEPADPRKHDEGDHKRRSEDDGRCAVARSCDEVYAGATEKHSGGYVRGREKWVPGYFSRTARIVSCRSARSARICSSHVGSRRVFNSLIV